MGTHSELEQLIAIASTKETLGSSPIEMFLKEYGFSEHELTEAVKMYDLYIFYACWHYFHYKAIPHRFGFLKEAKRFKKEIKYRSYFKCSPQLKRIVLNFKRRSKQWQKNLKDARSLEGPKKRRILGRRMSFRRLLNDSSQKLSKSSTTSTTQIL